MPLCCGLRSVCSLGGGKRSRLGWSVTGCLTSAQALATEEPSGTPSLPGQMELCSLSWLCPQLQHSQLNGAGKKPC